MTRRQRHVFPTYEAREDAFRAIVSGLIPRRCGGARLFWQDLREASGRSLSAALERPVAQITANPRDCLAFGSARQVLAAALSTAAGRPPAPEAVEALGRQFDLDGHLGQPIRTLSGGESVMLALAKAAALAPAVGRLAIASPFSWLSRDNRRHLEALLQHYDGVELPVDILILDGEDFDRPEPPTNLAPGPGFDLCLVGVRSALSHAFGMVGARPEAAAVDDFSAALQSPCLIVGANGQGKSLVAKILARASAFEGRAEVRVAGRLGGVRLLFQDVLTQTLLRAPEAIAAAAGSGRQHEVLGLAAAMEEDYQKFRREIVPGGDDARLPALGTIKTVLTAARLCIRPAALILDEPDWGLSRADAIAFVRSVIAAAHRQETAVLIISHKPWWTESCPSVVAVTRSDPLRSGDAQTALTVRLQQVPPDQPGGPA